MVINNKGFTLIELLVVITLIAILSAIISTIINPLEILKRGRDSIRLSDLANVQIAINVLIQDNPDSKESRLCENLIPPCLGTSADTDADVRKTDGKGWVKVVFYPKGPITASTLPIDPVNSGEYIYSYATNESGDKWEIDAKLESERENWRMNLDGGNNPNKYEVGLDLNILH